MTPGKLLRPLLLSGVLVLLLAACSGAPAGGGTASGSGPAIELYLQTDSGPLLITSGGLVGRSPVFEVRLVDDLRVVSADYRVGTGTWLSLAGHGFDRLNFRPEAALTGSSSELSIRATNSAGESSEVTVNLRVDAQLPVLEAFTVYGDDYLGAAIPEFPLDDENDLPMYAVSVQAQASDQGAGSAGLSIVLEKSGEVVHIATGSHFDHIIDARTLPEGTHRYELYAVDGVGNTSVPVSFLVNGPPPPATGP